MAYVEKVIRPMKRVTITLGITIVVILCTVLALSTQTPIYASVATNQPTQVALQSTASPDLARLVTALLIPPAQCVSPCIWEFQPGKQTLADFKGLVLSAFGNAAQAYAAPDQVVTGFYSSGVALHTAPITNPTPSSVVAYLYVRVAPAEARAAAVNFDALAPASVIKAFGKPADAFLLFDKKLRRFTLFLYYPAQSLVYAVRSAFENGKACLTLTNVETLTVYRFKDAASAQQFIKEGTGPGDTLPPSISTNTRQTVNDFTQIAQSPTTKCLSPK